jgi:hypothetical protein
VVPNEKVNITAPDVLMMTAMSLISAKWLQTNISKQKKPSKQLGSTLSIFKKKYWICWYEGKEQIH